MIDRLNTSSSLSASSTHALSAIVQQHLDMIHATAMSQLHDCHLADDATQAVFLLLLRRKDKLPPAPFLPGWLYKTTCYVAAEIRRQNLRRQRRDQEAQPLSQIADPSSTAITQEQRTALHAAIACLSSADRSAIVLSYLEGRTAAETAVTLGTSETALRSRLTRARERLRSLLRRAGITLSAAALLTVLDSSQAHAAPAALLPQIQALVQGAAPTSHILSLVNGVLQMTLRIKLIAIAVIVVLLALSLGIYVATLTDQKPAASPAVTSAPTSHTASLLAPATAPVARLSPKEVLLGVFQNALAGDDKAVINSFESIDENQAASLRYGIHAMAAFNDLTHAVLEKLNFDISPFLSTTLGTDMDTTDVKESTEEITGDTATVIVTLKSSGKSQKVSLPLVKIGDEWKFSSAIWNVLNLKGIDTTGNMEQTIKQIAADVRAGKYQSAAEFQTAAMTALSKLRTSPPTQPTPPTPLP